MLHGKFEGSFSEDFTVGVEELHRITSNPKEGEFTEQEIDNRKGFRYVRYLSPKGGHGNVAEIEFHGDLKGASGK